MAKVKKTQMNTLLASLEHSQKVASQNITQYVAYFKNKSGAFTGEHKTYAAREGFEDDPSKSGIRKVVTTVDEQFAWLQNTLKPFLEQQFAVEATNSKGANRVPLMVGDVNFGMFSALELMRMKSILTNADFLAMFKSIPVRSDETIWTPTKNENYKGRAGIFEGTLMSGVAHTTVSEDVILKDPNIDPEHLPSNYRATTTTRRKLLDVGDYTRQCFSGEWTQQQRAEALNRISKLTEAVIAALKEVNEIDAEDANLNVDSFMNYLFKG